MKKLIPILGLAAVSLVSSCTSKSADKAKENQREEMIENLAVDSMTLQNIGLGFATNPNNIDELYFNDQLVQGGQWRSFEVISSTYFKDANQVYWRFSDNKISVISWADPATFKILDNEYTADANNVYYLGKKIDLLNPKTVKALWGGYIKDDKNVFYLDRYMKVADAETFTVSMQQDTYGYEVIVAKDVHNEYNLDQIHVEGKKQESWYKAIDRSKRPKKDYFLHLAKEGEVQIDEASLTVVGNFFKTKDGLYIIGGSEGWDEVDQVVSFVNDSTPRYGFDYNPSLKNLQHIKGIYYKANDTIYIGEYDLDAMTMEDGETNVDAKSFKVIDDMIAVDKFNVYVKDIIVEDLDPNTTQVKRIVDDKEHVEDTRYIADKNYTYVRDGTRLRPEKTSLQIDIATLEPIQGVYYKDKNHIYCGDTIVAADYATFKSLDGVYAIDKENVYYYGRFVCKDPTNFRLIQKTGQYIDGIGIMLQDGKFNRLIQNGEIVTGKRYKIPVPKKEIGLEVVQ